MILILIGIITIGFSQTQVTQGEYFWDTDPGEGNGTALLALDGNFDEALEELFVTGISTTSLTQGAHRFYVRIKGNDGTWSSLFKQVIYIDAPLTLLTRTCNITQGEYFWDADPGEGNGTTLLALDGSFDEALEELFASGISTSSLTFGAHSFGVRVKGNDQTWSRVFKQTIFIEGGTTNFEEVKNDIILKVFPNPANDIINIKVEGSKNSIMSCKIIDASGKLVLNISVLQKQTVDVSGLSKGVYSLIIYNETVFKSERIVIR